MSWQINYRISLRPTALEEAVIISEVISLKAPGHSFAKTKRRFR
jgi:hypothetical protein